MPSDETDKTPYRSPPLLPGKPSQSRRLSPLPGLSYRCTPAPRRRSPAAPRAPAPRATRPLHPAVSRPQHGHPRRSDPHSSSTPSTQSLHRWLPSPEHVAAATPQSPFPSRRRSHAESATGYAPPLASATTRPPHRSCPSALCRTPSPTPATPPHAPALQRPAPQRPHDSPAHPLPPSCLRDAARRPSRHPSPPRSRPARKPYSTPPAPLWSPPAPYPHPPTESLHSALQFPPRSQENPHVPYFDATRKTCPAGRARYARRGRSHSFSTSRRMMNFLGPPVGRQIITPTNGKTRSFRAPRQGIHAAKWPRPRVAGPSGRHGPP